jgi:hypothetical protein
LKLEEAAASEFRWVLFQSPRGDFGFLKLGSPQRRRSATQRYVFQSPRGDFGFLKLETGITTSVGAEVSIPSRGFWFFEGKFSRVDYSNYDSTIVSIPSRGFWFFEA